MCRQKGDIARNYPPRALLTGSWTFLFNNDDISTSRISQHAQLILVKSKKKKESVNRGSVNMQQMSVNVVRHLYCGIL